MTVSSLILFAQLLIKPLISKPIRSTTMAACSRTTSGYMLLAQKLYTEGHNYAQAYNFGPHHLTIQLS